MGETDQNNCSDREGRIRILIVDDFETNRQVLTIHLGRLDVDLDQAETGAEALALLNGTCYDLILLDIFMPEMSGLELAQTIRERWPLPRIPILGLTASNATEDLTAALAAGMDGVMIKPIKKSALLDHIAQYLDIQSQAP